MLWHWSSSEKSSFSKPIARVFSSPPIITFSYGARICPPLVQLIGHVSALNGYPQSTYTIKYLNLDLPPPCMRLYVNTSCPFVRTHFQYWILPLIRWEDTVLIFCNGMSSLVHLIGFSIEIKRTMQKSKDACDISCFI